jgi:hypothetical protein
MELTWIKSSLSEAGNSVEVAHLEGGGIAMRNGQHPEVELHFTRDEWDAFRGGVNKGEFDHFGR